MRWGWITSLGLMVALLAGCCCATPDEVRTSLTNNLDDFVQIEKQMLPAIPAGTTFTYTNIHGVEVTKPFADVLKQRLRGLLFRGAGLKAWADGEAYDPEAAFKTLFPELAKEMEGSTP